jgi:DNA polymerase III epsilon subunit-like protein
MAAPAPAPSAASAAAVDREEIVFLDVETSTPPRVLLLEFGAVVVCSRRLVDVSSYTTLVRPADLDAVPDPTARCNGITRDTVADAPPFRDVADKVYDVLHGEYVVSACSPFDHIVSSRAQAN